MSMARMMMQLQHFRQEHDMGAYWDAESLHAIGESWNEDQLRLLSAARSSDIHSVCVLNMLRDLLWKHSYVTEWPKLHTATARSVLGPLFSTENNITDTTPYRDSENCKSMYSEGGAHAPLRWACPKAADMVLGHTIGSPSRIADHHQRARHVRQALPQAARCGTRHQHRTGLASVPVGPRMR
jgi:hypothetical protein